MPVCHPNTVAVFVCHRQIPWSSLSPGCLFPTWCLEACYSPCSPEKSNFNLMSTPAPAGGCHAHACSCCELVRRAAVCDFLNITKHMQQWESSTFETHSSWPIWSGQLSSFPISAGKNDKYCVFRLLLEKQTRESVSPLVKLAPGPLACSSCSLALPSAHGRFPGLIHASWIGPNCSFSSTSQLRGRRGCLSLLILS